LHLFVDHVIVELVLSEVLHPMLLVSQSTTKVEINDYDARNTHMVDGDEKVVPEQQLPQHLTMRRRSALSDFEITNGKEDIIFT
jgi:hypothetical protein